METKTETRFSDRYASITMRRSAYNQLKERAGDKPVASYLFELMLLEEAEFNPKMVISALAAIEAKVDELAEKLHLMDAKSWTAFLDQQRQIIQLTVSLGLVSSALEQTSIPGLKGMIEEQGKPLAEKMFRELCLKNGWNEIIEDEGPNNSGTN